jgi:MFS family permease
VAQEIVIRSERDVARFVSTQPTSKSAIFIVLVALGGIFVDAYDLTSLGVGVVQLRAQFHLSPFMVGSVTAMMAFGAVIGAMWGGYFTDKVGRFKMFLLDLIFLVVAAIGAALSVNIWMLLFFRLLMGIGVGLDFPVALSFIAEYVNEKKRGGSINLWQPVWYIATSCTGLVILPFYYLSNGSPHLWRIALGFGAVPALIILFLRYRFMDESPTWAAHYLGLQEAARVLEKMYKVKVTVEAEEKVEPKRKEAKVDFFEIFSPKYRVRTFLVSVIGITQATEYYAVGFNLPTISTRLFGNEFIYAILGTIFFNIFGIIGGFGGVAGTNKLGVRRLTLIGYTIVVISLFTIYFSGPKLPVIGTALLLGMFIFGHSLGQGSQGMTMATLSFPTRIRGVGTGFAQGMTRCGTICGFYFFPLMVAMVGVNKMLAYLALIPLFGLITTLCIKWEPVGQDIDEQDSIARLASSTDGATTASSLR